MVKGAHKRRCTIIVALWGLEKSGKTTLALTFPKPILHLDLDVGGYNRAAWRMDTKDVSSISYPVPLQTDKMIGMIKDGVTLTVPKKIVGVKELWQTVITAFVAGCQDEKVSTIIVDSATALWSICHRAYLQELQEKQQAQSVADKDLRERLQPIEYGEPNDRMKSVIFTARSFNKNLVLTHYPRAVYASKLTDKGVQEYDTGEKDIDGFKQTKALVDIAIKTELKGTTMSAVVTLSGLGLGLVDMEFQGPTYQMLKSAIEMSRGQAKEDNLFE